MFPFPGVESRTPAAPPRAGRAHQVELHLHDALEVRQAARRPHPADGKAGVEQLKTKFRHEDWALMGKITTVLQVQYSAVQCCTMYVTIQYSTLSNF